MCPLADDRITNIVETTIHNKLTNILNLFKRNEIFFYFWYENVSVKLILSRILPRINSQIALYTSIPFCGFVTLMTT